jgi:DNA-directed RNA polymerase specialized sigma24 family protein
MSTKIGCSGKIHPISKKIRGRALLGTDSRGCHDPDAFGADLLRVVTKATQPLMRLFPGEDLEDMAQYSLLEVWKQRREYRAREGQWTTWAWMIAVRRLYDLARQRDRARQGFARFCQDMYAAGQIPEA